MIYIEEEQKKLVTFDHVSELAKSLLDGYKYIFKSKKLISVEDKKMLFMYGVDYINDLSRFINTPLGVIKPIPWYKHTDFTSRKVPVFIHVRVDDGNFITEVDYYNDSNNTLVDMNGKEFPVNSNVVIFDIADIELIKDFFKGHKNV